MAADTVDVEFPWLGVEEILVTQRTLCLNHPKHYFIDAFQAS